MLEATRMLLVLALCAVLFVACNAGISKSCLQKKISFTLLKHTFLISLLKQKVKLLKQEKSLNLLNFDKKNYSKYPKQNLYIAIHVKL